ncbi:class I SAM-dependent methyltransferase [Kribbella sp. NPDC050820]|uniref:class I SAM-dependent methyltransferase n=1 Tax=Kribbella sp. NPDC050820 TaxID=3155408 RepID=UPI0033D72AFA
MIARAAESAATALGSRLQRQALWSAELLLIGVGLDLNLYPLLDGVRRTSGEVADAAGIDSRYAREWLEQQAVAGVVEVDPLTGGFGLPPGHANVLLEPGSSSYAVAACVRPLQGMFRLRAALARAYRSGTGLDAQLLGDFHGGELNTSLFRRDFLPWLLTALAATGRSVADVGSVVDIGCGTGESSFAMARGLPGASVLGVDVDGPALARAAIQRAGSEVGRRVRFVHADITEAEFPAADLVCILDMLHEAPDPLAVLSSARRLVSAGGAVVVLEPRAAEVFGPNGDDNERFLYCCSLLHCLPLARAADGAVEPTGAVLRPTTVRRLARAAGFTRSRTIELPQPPDGSRRHLNHRMYLLEES